MIPQKRKKRYNLSSLLSMMKTSLLIIFIALILYSCSAGKASFSTAKKYSPYELTKDYSLYEEILEAHHPGLYWYTTKDSMQAYFQWGREQLKDSMTEPEFRKVLNYVTAKIDCGHTTVRPSKKWSRQFNTIRFDKLFPLSIKVWPDTMVVTANLNRKDTVLKRGTVITSIDGRSVTSIVDTMFGYISTDGYNLTHKYQTLSNRGFFGSMYTSLFGLRENYTIDYLGTDGRVHTTTTPVFNPAADTAGRRLRRPVIREPQPSKKERKRQELNSVRLLKIDSVNKTAMMDLSTFARGYNLRHFFRKSFRVLQQNSVGHLIIDVRSNGGGSVTNSTFLTRYLTDHKFKIADTLFALRKRSHYFRFIQNHAWNEVFMFVFTHKRKDGHYHFGYFEKHYFSPKRSNHFDGQVYILTGGNSFSATTLFTSALVKQDNVTVVGEETGGGAYGNSAWLIPDVTLPYTHVRFRLPLFRLVIDKNVPKVGRGVQPEVPAPPTVEAIRNNRDFKLDKAMELIREDKNKKKE